MKKLLKTTKSVLNTINRSKEKVWLGVLSAFAAPSVFADSTLVPAQLGNLANNILGAFTSTPVRTIIAISVCASAIGFAVNKDNEKAKKSFGAILIATCILLVGSTVVTSIWNSASTSG